MASVVSGASVCSTTVVPSPGSCVVSSAAIGAKAESANAHVINPKRNLNLRLFIPILLVIQFILQRNS